LDSINVYYRSSSFKKEHIRSYKFEYNHLRPFVKTTLEKVTQLGAEYSEFVYHSFGYEALPAYVFGEQSSGDSLTTVIPNSVTKLDGLSETKSKTPFGLNLSATVGPNEKYVPDGKFLVSK